MASEWCILHFTQNKAQKRPAWGGGCASSHSVSSCLWVFFSFSLSSLSVGASVCLTVLTSNSWEIFLNAEHFYLQLKWLACQLSISGPKYKKEANFLDSSTVWNAARLVIQREFSSWHTYNVFFLTTVYSFCLIAVSIKCVLHWGSLVFPPLPAFSSALL